jgi:hypothetical protein
VLSRHCTPLRQHYATAHIAGRHKCRPYRSKPASSGVIDVALRFRVVSGDRDGPAMEDRARVIAATVASEDSDGIFALEPAAFGRHDADRKGTATGEPHSV